MTSPLGGLRMPVRASSIFEEAPNGNWKLGAALDSRGRAARMKEVEKYMVL